MVAESFSLDSEKIGEWCDNLFSRMPDVTILSISFVNMLSMQVLRHSGFS